MHPILPCYPKKIQKDSISHWHWFALLTNWKAVWTFYWDELTWILKRKNRPESAAGWASSTLYGGGGEQNRCEAHKHTNSAGKGADATTSSTARAFLAVSATIHGRQGLRVCPKQRAVPWDQNRHSTIAIMATEMQVIPRADMVVRQLGGLGTRRRRVKYGANRADTLELNTFKR